MTGIIERARELDKEYGIFNALADLDDSTGDGRLEGIAISVKDNICVMGMETRAGSKVLEGYRPPFDATVVKKCREEGALILGTSQSQCLSMPLLSHCR